jgi:adenylylsulfate kinase
MAYSLFIGRWQPFHEGHKKLIQSVLDEGKDVCVAIRDTELSKDNPYTTKEREAMILMAFPQVKVIVIPDISEICFGRKVGYGIRELKLDEVIEAISGTEIRRAA